MPLPGSAGYVARQPVKGVPMAWYIETSLRNEDRPKPSVAPEGVAAFDKVCDAMTAKYEKLPKGDPLYAVADPVQMFNGFELPGFRFR
jgi:hypothetical protein